MILPSQVQGDQKDWHVTYRAIKLRYYVQVLLSFRKPNMLVRIDSRFSLYPTYWKQNTQQKTRRAKRAGQVWSSGRNLLAVHVFLRNSALGAWPSCFVTIVGETCTLLGVSKNHSRQLGYLHFRSHCVIFDNLTGNLHNNVETWHSQVSTLSPNLTWILTCQVLERF